MAKKSKSKSGGSKSGSKSDSGGSGDSGSMLSRATGSGLLSKGAEIVAAGADVLATQLADELGRSRDKDFQDAEKKAEATALANYRKEFAANQRLVKAALIPRTGESAPTIRFMFNPTDLQFSRSVSIENVKGARTFRGLPKVNFGFIEPYELKLSGLVFDTYETGEDVYTLIKPLRDSVDFSNFQDPFKKGERKVKTTALGAVTDKAVSAGVDALGKAAGGTASLDTTGFREYGVDLDSQALELRRPPVYYFIWGEHSYIRCMIKDFSFKLTMFLPNGRPVRAMVDLSLQEVDLGVASHALSERKKILDFKSSS